MQRYVTLIWLSLYLLSTMTLAGCGEFNISDAGMFDDVNDLQARVAQGEDINFQDMYGDTPLINSVFFGNLENVQYLLENGANVQLKNYDGNNSILVWPILDKDDDEAILKLLLQYGANINEKDSANETPLHIAILFGRNKHVSMLVDNGVDVNVKGVNGMTPVAYVMESKVSENSISMLQKLIDGGADLNIKDIENQESPLDDAVYYGKPEFVRILLENGADPNIRDRFGETPIFEVCKLKLDTGTQIIDLLLDYGADINARDLEGDRVDVLTDCANNSGVLEHLYAKGLKKG
jgi:ankyrin repeat protein